jgi:queuine tRNA-ribosyltransferase
MGRLGFEVIATATGSQARAGRFRTLHGEVHTPVFMPVGTQATVKGLTVEDLEAAGAEVLLANAYHLLLRPGVEVFERVGGIHRFMNWRGSVLTDSGGYQVFSLDDERVVTEDGAIFRSYVDGTRVVLSPERSITAQLAIGSDIMMAMDHCIPSTSTRAAAMDAMHRTHRWAERSLAARGDAAPALFGIVQGACFDDLREESAACLTRLPFDGFAIGGLAVGESKAERERCTALTTALLPPHLPRYLMGVGTPIDLLEAVDRGVDMFDCIIPSFLAKQGVAYTSTGRLNLYRGVYKLDERPVDAACPCETCAGYARAYLHHLIKAGEPLGWNLLTRHNLRFYHELMRAMRRHIAGGTFATFRDEERPRLASGDDEHPSHASKPRRRRRDEHALERFAVRVSEHGYASIVERASGEVMHPGLDPRIEAEGLYVAQSRLAERLREPIRSPLVVWDVGLGAAHNATAAVRCCEAAAEGTEAGQRPLHILSFENDMAALRLALRSAEHFPHLRSAGPNHLLRFGEWRSERAPLVWTLLEGDFLSRMADAPVPDLVYYDPFSPKTDGSLWTLDCFERVFAVCHEHDTELFTYSASTAIRAALSVAGFVVGRGAPTGAKTETTLAATPLAATRARERGRDLLGPEWLERWHRSDAKFPSDVAPEAQASFGERLAELPQLRSESGSGTDAGAGDPLPPARRSRA